jgi:class 3 adenylate cyclase
MEVIVNPKYSVPHYSTKLWRAYKLYLDHFYGKNLFSEICRELQISEDYLNKDDNWVSDEFTRKFMKILIEHTGDEDIARKVGQFSLSPDAINNLEYALLKIIPPVFFLKLFQFNASKLNRFHEISVLESKIGYFQIQMKTANVSSDPHVYRNAAGILEALKEFYDLDDLRVQFDVAPTANGGQSAVFCVYYTGKKLFLKNFTKAVITASIFWMIYYFSKSHLPSITSNISYAPAIITIIFAMLGVFSYSFYKFNKVLKYLKFYHRQEKEKSLSLYNSSLKLERRIQEAQLLKELSSELIGCADSREVIEKCINSMAQKFSYNKVAVFLLSKKRERLYLSNSIGFEHSGIDASKIEFIYPNPDKKEGFIASVLDAGVPALIDDIDKYKTTLKASNQKLLELLSVGSMIISPIFSGESKYGVILITRSKEEEPLTAQDRFLVENIGAQLSLYFESASNFENEKQLRQIFQKYVPRPVLEQISVNLHSSDGALKPQKKEICSVFMDLRGFTAACDTLSAEKAFDLINNYANFTTKILSEEGAIIDNIIADEIVAFFSRGDSNSVNHADAALRAAYRIKDEFEKLNNIFIQNGIPSLKLGIGINLGEATVGSVGGDAKMNFTAIGTTVNIASRLQGLSKKFTDETVTILVSRSFYERIGNHAVNFDSEVLRGTSEATEFVCLNKEIYSNLVQQLKLGRVS